MASAARAFAAEFEPAEELGRRRSMRAPVSLDAKIGRGGLDRALCKVTDLSLHGARIQTYSLVKANSGWRCPISAMSPRAWSGRTISKRAWNSRAR
jgi:hypothetical protein